jgi:inorganic pyrophosphatase
MDLIAGYGLGGSAMALFGRVGGGIYTKAADVGADLAGKLENGLAEDDPRNPATVADNVGDNVGDIAGMGSDLFGSLAESTCASLVLISSNTSLFTPDNMQVLWYPLMISAAGIVACLITVQFAFYIYKVTERARIMKSLNLQLLISTVLELAFVWLISYWNLPAHFSQNNKDVVGALYKDAQWWAPAICVTVGLISGFLIGIATDYYTSNAHAPVQEIAEQCFSGAAINIIYGLAVGYLSTIIPIFLLAITIIVCVSLLGMLGVALAAIGMLSTLSVGLAIDSYGPISDNAGGIAELCQCRPEVREVTDALDAAGNTTAAIGKGFAIGSAALVSLSLYGAFITRIE